MKQHKVTGLEAALRLRAFEQVLHGQALEHHGRAGFKGNGVRQFAHALGRHHAQFAIAARRLAGIGGPVAHLQMRHALADGLDHARGFHAHLQRHGQGIQAGTLVDVDVVQTHGLVADADLARAGLAHRDIDQLEFFGAAVFVDAYGARGMCAHFLCSSNS